MKTLSVRIIGLVFTISQAWAQKQQHSVKIPDDIQKLLQQYACLACHKADTKLIGPGYPPMAPMKHVLEKDALKIAAWINSLAKKHS